MKLLSNILIYLIVFTGAIHSQGSLCAVGGGSEDINSWSDKPYSWIVEQADSGKIIILSYSSATDWLPNYFKRFGASEAINFTIGSRLIADEQSTYDAIVSAKGVFLKGGDQSRYLEYWKETKTEDAIKQVFLNGGVIAGTSAGAMVLSEIVFTAEKTSIQPRSALVNPFSTQITLDDDFLGLMPNVLFDTHFVERGRIGRLIPFILNYRNNTQRNILGVGIDDRTAICIDSEGLGKVYGSGAVSIIQFDEQTIYKNLNDEYSLQHLKVDKLLHSWSYDFNSRSIVAYSENTKPANFNVSNSLPINNIYFTGDDNFNTNFGKPFSEFTSENTFSKIAFIYDEESASSFDAIIENLLNAGVLFETVLVNSQNLLSNEIEQKVGECDALVFFGSNLNELVKLSDNLQPVSAAVLQKIQSGVPLMFMGTASKLVAEILSTNNEDDNLASYYGELDFQKGLDVLSNAIVQPRVFRSSDFYENNVTSIEYAMMLSRSKYGFYVDQNDIVKYSADEGLLKFSGRYPILIADASESTMVDSSIYRISSNSGTRQVIGINNLRYTVSTLDTLFSFINGSIVTVDKSFPESIPKNFILSQNFPNPFNPSTTIAYTIPVVDVTGMPGSERNGSDASLITIRIYDILGSEVVTLVNKKQKPGSYNIVWDASNFPSGVYFYRVITETAIVSKKMILVK